MHLLSVLSVLSISFILAWISKGVGRERLGQTPGERKLGMTAKPAGPLYMCFFYVISVVIESLPMDVLHSHSIYLSLLTLSVPVPSTQNFSLAAAFISLFFCLSKRCLFYPASHRYSAKWLGCSHRIKVSFNILRMQTLHLFLRVLCARVLVLIPSPFVPPTLVLLFFFSKTFLWFTHMSSCVRRATGCLNRKQQIQVCVCHHIKASICTCICLWKRKHARRSEADSVSDGVCMLRATFAVSQPDLRIFLMDHKGGAAYRGRPRCLFIEKNKPCVLTDALTECSDFHCWLELT